MKTLMIHLDDTFFFFFFFFFFCWGGGGKRVCVITAHSQIVCKFLLGPPASPNWPKIASLVAQKT